MKAVSNPKPMKFPGTCTAPDGFDLGTEIVEAEAAAGHAFEVLLVLLVVLGFEVLVVSVVEGDGVGVAAVGVIEVVARATISTARSFSCW